MARLATPLMTDGGSIFTMSYGANKVVPNYNVMGPVKAALEACARYLAYELGPNRIRVHAISPGPVKTRAAWGLKDLICCSTRGHSARHSGNWSTSWMSGSRAPSLRRRLHGACRAKRCISTAACTSWLKADF